MLYSHLYQRKEENGKVSRGRSISSANYRDPRVGMLNKLGHSGLPHCVAKQFGVLRSSMPDWQGEYSVASPGPCFSALRSLTTRKSRSESSSLKKQINAKERIKDEGEGRQCLLALPFGRHTGPCPQHSLLTSPLGWGQGFV